jgi:penicillin amidase
MRTVVPTILAVATLVGGMWIGMAGAGPLPPVAPILDPWNGAWASGTRALLPLDATASIPNLAAPVDVRYDRRGVPHVFATTEYDAIRALGFVAARDRLFQMEVQTRGASGRLTEWAGPRALEADREMRALGLPAAAEAHMKDLPADSRARRFLDAYTDGVNAWIDAMRPADLPVEYRLLNARPERWEPVNTLHLFSRMGWTLASNAPERARAAAAAVVGREAAAALFPLHTPIVEPIQPNGAGAPRLDFQRIPPPGAPDSTARAILAAFGTPPASDEPRSIHASNNWAVAPARTMAGKALLAGDPHLQMTLPSLWYEAHLVVPGVLDVYGVTIPGAPAIIIGFTGRLAWSLTNTGADVMDYYSETVDDVADPGQYQVDGQWRRVERRVETYRGPAGGVLHVDTLRFTHRGPMSRSGDGQWLSMRWTVLDPNLDPAVFLDAAGKQGTRDFLDVMAAGLGAPAQNVIVADRSGSIAIRSTGFYPIRPAGTDGLDIHDGSRSASDWVGYWPLERYPQSFDPAQGYLASANQEPKDPHVDPGYVAMDGEFDPWRAMQINRLLRADSAVTPDAMRRYQTDPGSVRADLFVPFFLNAGRQARARGASNASLDSAVATLSRWDRRYTRENDDAVLFEAAMRELVARTWDELAPEGGRRVATPSTATLLGLLHDSTSTWWDHHATETMEDRDAIVAWSLEVAHDSLSRVYGPRAGGGWRWSRTGTTRMTHLLGLPAFSELDVPVQGGPSTLNPSSRGGHGPSWRMVVELGDTVRGWGTYPGGQSGNPMSPRYADRLSRWREGELDTLIVPRDTSGLPAGTASARLRLLPGSGR